MQVALSTWNRFWFFDLAEQLYNNDCLHSISTTLPRSRARKDAVFTRINKNRLNAYPPFFMVEIALSKMLGRANINEAAAILSTITYQQHMKRFISKNIENIDAYIAISGSGYKGGKYMIDNSKPYCFDRGSTEINHQLEVMQNLHDHLSLPCRKVAKWLIDNETKEAQIATVITVPSSYCKQTYIDKGYKADKVHVIPYGVNLREFYRDPEIELASKNEIIFCGQFSIRKGAHLLVDYFRANPYQNCRLSVVGSIHPNLHKLFGNKVIPNIDFHGVVPRAQVRQYMQDSKALILPSYEEGLALVIPQALACGLPVIASVQSGATEYIRDGYNGFILEDISCQSIHEAIKKLYSLNPQDQNQMSEHCKSSVKHIGGWDEYGQQWINLLNTVLQPIDVK